MTYSLIPATGNGVLASDVAAAGTFTTGYPSGKDKGNFFLAMGHKLVLGQATLYFPVDFDVTFTSSTVITITNKTSATWAANTTWRLQLEERGERAQLDVPLQSPNAATSGITGSTYSINSRSALIPSTSDSYLDLVTLGAPIALDADGIAAAQAVGTPALAASLQINGSLASGGTVTLDVPRAVQTVSSNGGDNTQTLTVVGTDVYGYTMSEALALAGTTAVLGSKAFKRILRASVSATLAGNITIGTTDKLGLPIFVPSQGYVLAELRDGNNVGGARTTQVPFFINQTDLLAPTNQELVSPVQGFVTGAFAVVTGNTVATGGNIAIKVGGTDVTGLTLVIAGSAAPGTVVSDRPTTPFSSTTQVTIGARLTVAPDASFATSGSVNGYIEVTGLSGGTLVPGVRTAGGSTTTTGDVRGTYTPTVACDGSTVFDLVVLAPQRSAGMAQNAVS